MLPAIHESQDPLSYCKKPPACYYFGGGSESF